jgi:hypothetical protein
MAMYINGMIQEYTGFSFTPNAALTTLFIAQGGYVLRKGKSTSRRNRPLENSLNKYTTRTTYNDMIYKLTYENKDKQLPTLKPKTFS